MKKVFTSLPFKLLVGVVIGIIAGQFAGFESAGAVGDAVMNVVVTVRFVLSELINFCVPLIVIGFIAPSITRLGRNASRMLGVALICAYMSSILAALLSMAAGYGIIPRLSIVSEVEGLKELPEVIFRLEIPEIMSVMSALVLSVLLGLACTWTNAVTITNMLEEFQKIVLQAVPAGVHSDRTDRHRGALFLDGGALYRSRYLFGQQPAGCGKELRTGIHYRHRNYVVVGDAGGGAALCEEIRAAPSG